MRRYLCTLVTVLCAGASLLAGCGGSGKQLSGKVVSGLTCYQFNTGAGLPSGYAYRLIAVYDNGQRMANSWASTSCTLVVSGVVRDAISITARVVREASSSTQVPAPARTSATTAPAGEASPPSAVPSLPAPARSTLDVPIDHGTAQERQECVSLWNQYWTARQQWWNQKVLMEASAIDTVGRSHRCLAYIDEGSVSEGYATDSCWLLGSDTFHCRAGPDGYFTAVIFRGSPVWNAKLNSGRLRLVG